jgi:hypothetical protein
MPPAPGGLVMVYGPSWLPDGIAIPRDYRSAG